MKRRNSGTTPPAGHRHGRGARLLAIGVPDMAVVAVGGYKKRHRNCGAQEVKMGSGFGPEKFMRHMHGPGARFFERGGIKFAILELLKTKPRHGYDIIREMEERSGGFYSPSPGAVYPTLQALEDQDLVSSTTEEGKKVYSVTAAGLAYLEEHKEQAKSHRERWAAHWAPGPHGEGWSAMSDMKDTFADVMRAVRRSAGDPGKMKEIREVLQEAAKKVADIARR